MQECSKKYAGFPFKAGIAYCKAIFDTYLCWPPTPAGETASQQCPAARLSDTTHSAFRTCGENGFWTGKRPNDTNSLGWTNYTPCFPPAVQTLLVMVNEEDEVDAQAKFDIAQRTRYLEIVGFSISLIALLISLWIFSRYKSLRNKRTRIHQSLFSAMVVQVIIRLILYIDQALPVQGINNMPYLCEGTYVMLEYGTTVMFMWMFIEGLYLHNMVTANALRESIKHWVYYATGWGLPIIVTVLWATATGLHYRTEPLQTCWYGYNFSQLYWITQAPRLAVIMINLVFLLNIMRVLIVKLKRSESTEVEKVRKAVRAALVLLPLLGITNILNMTEAPLHRSVWMFGLWSYTTHFLRSFQGFFIALIYCFLNGEVRQVVCKHYENYMAMRGDNRRRRHCDSFLRYLSSSGPNQPGLRPPPEGDRATWMSLKLLKWTRGPAAANQVMETEMGPDRIEENNVHGDENEPVDDEEFYSDDSSSGDDSVFASITEKDVEVEVVTA